MFGSAQSSVTMICTPSLRELLNHGVPREFIFQKENNFCVAIGDNSIDVVQEGISWLLEQISSAFVFVQEELDDMTESEFAQNFDYIDKPYQGNHLESSIGSQVGGNQAAEQRQRLDFKAASESQSWLDDFIRFWNLEGI